MFQREPGPAHQAFIVALHATHGRFAGPISPVERLAIVSQFLGQLIGEIDDEKYGKAEVMQAVAMNLQAGNEQATGGVGNVPASGLLQVPK